MSFFQVHDLSLELAGSVAHDGHMFANKQWNYIESKQETFWGTIVSVAVLCFTRWDVTVWNPKI